MFLRAPTLDLDTNEWSYTDFETRKDVFVFIKTKYKYPGEYNLKHTEGVWNEQANIYRNTKAYPVYSTVSKDYRKHWDFEKEKCNFSGFIIYKKPSEGLEYAVPGVYYFYLNYCPIPDKVKNRPDFADIWDGDLHYFLYIYRCIIERKYSAVIKKRQSGYTLKNIAIILCRAWFSDNAVCKIFAKDLSKVTDAWVFMEGYRNHINNHCAFRRPFDPGEGIYWQQRLKQLDGTYKGNDSIIAGFTTHRDPTNGIGGNASIIYAEEAGANDTLDKSMEFISSNVAMGGLITGLVMVSGAVGELTAAAPLKKFVTKPTVYGFLPCENNIPDDAEFGAEVGFFVPEWWNYTSVEEDEQGNTLGEALKCYDEWGNSNKEKALAEIYKWRKLAELRDPENYQMYISQRPLSIREAFAYRQESLWPLKLIAKQKQRIEDGEFPVEYLKIVRGEDGKPRFETAAKKPIRDYPISKTAPDKEGCLEVYERPVEGFEFGKTYVASIDPVKTGKTVHSESLFCILVYRMDEEVWKLGDEAAECSVHPGKLALEWTGRFDDPNETFEQASLILEMYGAKAVVENNVGEFITYMIGKRRQQYLIPKKQILFLAEIGANSNAYQDYGWYNSNRMFDNHLINYGTSFMKEELHTVNKGGVDVVVLRGINRIPSIMIMKEAEAYVPGINCDRLIAYCALVAYVKIYLANYGYNKRKIYTNPKTKAPPPVVTKQFFKQRSHEDGAIQRQPFRNLK